MFSFKDLKRDFFEGFEYFGVEFGKEFPLVWTMMFSACLAIALAVQDLPYTPRGPQEMVQMMRQYEDSDIYCRTKFPIFFRRK